jgi:hypothetical protein
MKKKSLILMLTLIVLGAANAKAQVNIGSDAAPKPGAVLDLSQATNLGLKLPVVSTLPTPSSDAAGLLVYSTTGAKGAGLYAWSGTAWVAYQPAAAVGASLPTGVVATTGFTLINNSGTLEASAFTGSGTVSYQGVTWSVVSGSIEFDARTVTTCVIKSGTTGVVRATSIDGQHYEEITI